MECGYKARASGHEDAIYRWKSCFFNCHLFYIRTEREVEKGRVRGRQRKRRVNGGTSDSVSCLVELAIWGRKAHGA